MVAVGFIFLREEGLPAGVALKWVFITNNCIFKVQIYTGACRLHLKRLKPLEATVDPHVFIRIPRIERFKRDLKKAVIVYTDAQERVADFHSLRKTFGTNMARYGVPSRVAMALMRHRDRRLTDLISTDENMLGTKSAIESLPSFEKEACLASASQTGDISCHKQPSSRHLVSSSDTNGGYHDESQTTGTEEKRYDVAQAGTNGREIKMAGVLISNWNQIVQFLQQIAALQLATT